MKQNMELLRRYEKADDDEKVHLFLYYRDMRDSFQEIDEYKLATPIISSNTDQDKTSSIFLDVEKNERRNFMDERMKALIAIGASVTANCQSCIEYHFGKALELGIEKDVIGQAVEVAKGIRKGAANSMDKHALNLIQKSQPCAVPGSGTCSCCS